MMETKPRISNGIFTVLGISKKITEDWLMLNSVVSTKAHSSVDPKSSIFMKKRCITIESEKHTGIAKFSILILGTSFR